MRWLARLVFLLGFTSYLVADCDAAAPVDNLVGPAQFARRGAPPGVHPAIARIVAPGRNSVSYGSGTLVAAGDQYGVVITNWHVINECIDQPLVLFPDGFHSPAVISKVDRDWDLAALVIWKPAVQPVPIAPAAPAPGDALTIIGYGSGTYRAAAGRCTQYVAPGPQFPFEMVELSAMARQGDSGGPILNGRGELAGVLFGAGQGRTSGSYCGRVRWFLSSLTEGVQAPPPQLALGRAKADTSSADGRQLVNDQQLVDVPRVQARWQGESQTPTVMTGLERQPAPRTAPIASVRGTGTAVVPPSPPMTNSSPSAQTSRRYIGWSEIAGDSVVEQAKTILAGFGALSALLCFLKLVSRE